MADQAPAPNSGEKHGDTILVKRLPIISFPYNAR